LHDDFLQSLRMFGFPAVCHWESDVHGFASLFDFTSKYIKRRTAGDKTRSSVTTIKEKI
jgi:hypothetical protein